jgi:hypothetical protein
MPAILPGSFKNLTVKNAKNARIARGDGLELKALKVNAKKRHAIFIGLHALSSRPSPRAGLSVLGALRG